MSRMLRRMLVVVAGACCSVTPLRAELSDTIVRVRPSIVVVGAMKRTPSPHFDLHGTGFVVGDGTLVVTNAHVVAGTENATDNASTAVQARVGSGEVQLRRARIEAVDKDHDLAVLRVDGEALPPLQIGDSDSVREGMSIAFTGFPIGNALGFAPVTHRGIVSAITPIVLPAATTRQLNARAIKQIREGAFQIFQLDATAYPGNSGSPVFDPDSGTVVAIINMVFVKNAKEGALSQPSGISYAIPARFLAAMLRSGK